MQTTPPPYGLETRDLVKRFGGLVATDHVNLQVSDGTIHGLIGPNGAGKTTLFNLLTCTMRPSSGQILLKGRDITHTPAARVAQMGMARSFQISSVFAEMSVLDNLRLAFLAKAGKPYDFLSPRRRMRGQDDAALDLLEKVGLADRKDDPAGVLSYGRKRALELATTLALDPQVLLLDEPMAGLGREDIGAVVKLIADFAVGRTVIMVEHNLDVVADLCQRITVLRQGAVLAEGSYKDVSRNADVISAYLGDDNV